MWKLLLGFAAGVAAAALTFWLFVGEPSEMEPTVVGAPRGAGPASSDSESNLRQPDDTRRVGAEATAPEAIETPSESRESQPAPADEPREASLRRELEEARRIVEQTTAELQRLRIEGELAAQPIVSPIALPPQFDWIRDNFYREVFHERMQREPIEGAWAGATESDLLSFLYRRPEMVSKYGPPTVRCHTTQCEVTFIASGIYDDPSVASAAARSLFDDSFEEMDGSFDCGPGECWAEANSEGGVVTIFWAMTKDENEPQGEVAVATAFR